MAKNMLSLPPRQAQLADVDVDVSNRGGSELAALGAFVWVLGQSGDAVAFQAPVQAGARQLWDAVAQAAEHVVPRGTPDVIERQQRPAAELDHHGLLSQCQHGAVRGSRPHWRIVGRRSGAPLGDGGPRLSP